MFLGRLIIISIFKAFGIINILNIYILVYTYSILYRKINGKAFLFLMFLFFSYVDMPHTSIARSLYKAIVGGTNLTISSAWVSYFEFFNTITLIRLVYNLPNQKHI